MVPLGRHGMPGGCVGGPGTLRSVKQATVKVQEFVKKVTLCDGLGQPQYLYGCEPKDLKHYLEVFFFLNSKFYIELLAQSLRLYNKAVISAIRLNNLVFERTIYVAISNLTSLAKQHIFQFHKFFAPRTAL